MELSPLVWQQLDELVRRDPSARGLASYRDDDGAPIPNDLEESALDLVADGTRVLLVTGFAIVTPDGIRAETDGPLGAIFLAGMLRAAGLEVDIATDSLAAPLVRAGLHVAELDDVGLIETPDSFEIDYCYGIVAEGYSHFIAIERVGPNHTAESIAGQDAVLDAEREADEEPYEPQLAEFERLVVPADRDTCRNMRGDAIDAHTPPLHLLFDISFGCECGEEHCGEHQDEADESPGEAEAEFFAADDDTAADDDVVEIRPPITIGIVDGGNEIGCGGIAWSTLCRAVAKGPAALTACRISTNYLIIAGISNWGAYGLGAAVAAMAERQDVLLAWTAEREAAILRAIVAAGGVDGVLKRPEPSVDGVPLEPYLAVFDEIRRACL